MPLLGTRKSDRRVRNLDQLPVGITFFGDFSLGGFLIGIVLSIVLSILLWIPFLIIAELVRASARRTVPEVNLGTRQIRCGRKVVTFSDVDRAHLDQYGVLPTRSDLRLTATGSFEFLVPIRSNDALVLDSATQELLLAVLPQTEIELPVDPFDPKGKFTRNNFPGSLSKDGAIELVARTV